MASASTSRRVTGGKKTQTPDRYLNPEIVAHNKKKGASDDYTGAAQAQRAAELKRHKAAVARKKSKAAKRKRMIR